MKIIANRIALAVLLAFAAPAVAFQSGCSTPPSQRVATVQTLGVLGASAKAAMDSATQLLKQGAITVEQWQKVATFYDTKFQPSYTLAVNAAQADVTNIASPDLTSLAFQFLALVASFMPPPHANP